MKDIIIHVYYGTAGNAGLYIKKIMDALEEIDICTKAYVSYYFPFEGAEYSKLFFKYSEHLKPNIGRKIIKFLEMSWNFIEIISQIKRMSTRYNRIYVIYSLNENYLPSYYFLKALKKMKKVKIGITVHDIEPFHNNYIKIIMKNQDDLLEQSDFYIVHNGFSVNRLQEKFPHKKDFVFSHGFPLMDLSLLDYKDEGVEINGTIKFIFIGYLRKEKGVNTLIDAWRKIQQEYKNIKLVVAGRIPHNLNYDFTNLCNFELIDRFLTDDEFIKFVKESDYVILPYSVGTNSGILSTVSSLGKPSITSNLQMFKESKFVLEELMFNKDDPAALYELLKKIIENHNKNYFNLCRMINNKIEKFDDEFRKEIKHEYTKILSS